MKDAWDRVLRLFSAGLACLCLLQLAFWLPMYLTRPMYSDQDVFAAMAHGWDAGDLPYRDLLSNNFPGTIYIFWCLGKVFGWGSVRWFYAFDGALILALAALSLWWSRVRFGRFLPAIVGLLAVNSYYFKLDFSQAAQRDWHAPLLVVLGILAAQTWRNRAGRWLAALGFSAGMLIRPQVFVLLPAVLLAVTDPLVLAGASRSRTLKAAAAWLALVALLGFLGLVPLLRDGVLDDFLDSLRIVAFGGNYNKKTFGMFARMLAGELYTSRIVVVSLGLALLTFPVKGRPAQSLARTWLVALLGALLYAPLSPNDLPYLSHALWLVWSIIVAVLVGAILEQDIPLRGKITAVLLVLGIIGTAWPLYCWPSYFKKTLVALYKNQDVANQPSGYSSPYGTGLDLPPWQDYLDVLDYLRTKTTPETRVANLLMGIAICGPSGRLSALPAESATWVFIVKSSDEPRFARALEDCPDSVVVMWAPRPIPKVSDSQTEPDDVTHFPMLEEVTHRLYRLDARFGALEVWRRLPKDQVPAKLEANGPPP